MYFITKGQVRDTVISLTFVENEKNYIYNENVLNLELFIINNNKFLFAYLFYDLKNRYF